VAMTSRIARSSSVMSGHLVETTNNRKSPVSL
jgi:hypothetical protein